MKTITSKFYVAEQLAPEALPELAAAGIKYLICNRPDNEVEGQANSQQMQQAAEQHNIAFYYLPTAPGQFPETIVREFATLIEGLDGKVLAYCRTGMRSASLWALANPEHKSVAERIALTAAAGYDVSSLLDRPAQ